jgi:predicted RNA-binding protein with TRAM domain|tara:strand:- start:1695 stop:2051 length:357 start_codon:yes stop_codon:yes gene_type:complete
MYQDRNFRQMSAPVNIGDEFDVKIEAVGEKGDGIAKKDGFVLFVPNTKEGQEVKIRVTKVLRKVGFAEVVGENQASQEQVPAESEPQPEQEPAAQEEQKIEDTEDFGEEEAKEEEKKE